MSLVVKKNQTTLGEKQPEGWTTGRTVSDLDPWTRLILGMRARHGAQRVANLGIKSMSNEMGTKRRKLNTRPAVAPVDCNDGQELPADRKSDAPAELTHATKDYVYEDLSTPGYKKGHP